MTACNRTSQKVVLSINSCSLSLCLSLSHLLQLLYNLYGLGWFIHDHSVLCMCVCVCVCVSVYVCMPVRVCALGRPLECDSRPAQWQETPWRLWQAASCTPSFAFLSLSLTSPHYATHLSPRTSLHLLSSICIHSIHILPVFLFFFSTALALCLLGGSQRDLNNWTFLILYFFAYFFFCPTQWMSLSISASAYSQPSFISLTFTLYFVSWQWRQLPLVWPIWSI